MVLLVAESLVRCAFHAARSHRARATHWGAQEGDFWWLKLYATDNWSHEMLDEDDPLDFNLVCDPAMRQELL